MKIYRELLENNDYDAWKSGYDKLNISVEKLGKILQKFSKESGGLISDDLEFKKLQNFNKDSSKQFLKQASKDRRAKWRN